jgi:hypothetical protein
LYGKGDIHADQGPKDKKKRKMLSLLAKVEVLDMVDRGMGIAKVRHHYGVKKSTIHFTKKTEDENRGSTKATGCENFFCKSSMLLP